MKMTEGQLHRLSELGSPVDSSAEYISARNRDEAFGKLEKAQLKVNRKRLETFRVSSRQSPLIKIQEASG